MVVGPENMDLDVVNRKVWILEGTEARSGDMVDELFIELEYRDWILILSAAGIVSQCATRAWMASVQQYQGMRRWKGRRGEVSTSREGGVAYLYLHFPTKL